MSILRVVAVVFAGMVLSLSAARADTRVALVIGNSAYQNVPHLPNPTNDAGLIASALKQDGFEVTLADDLNHDAMINALRTFGKSADSADWAVVYYAGHGLEMGGVNYLIPVDAKLDTDRDVGFEAVPIDQVMSAIDGARTLRMVILDACRNDPFLSAMKRGGGLGRAIGRGLALVEPEQATLVAYSAKAGTIAEDGAGADSPFAMALAHHLTEPGVEVDKLFRLVRDDVLDATGNSQEPFVYGSLPGRQDFFFRPGATGAIPSPQDLPHATAAGLSTDAEIVFWESIKDSGREDDFRAYLDRFPEGTFATLARSRMASLEAPVTGSPSPGSSDEGIVDVLLKKKMMLIACSSRGKFCNTDYEYMPSKNSFVMEKYAYKFPGVSDLGGGPVKFSLTDKNTITIDDDSDVTVLRLTGKNTCTSITTFKSYPYDRGRTTCRVQ